MFDFHIPSHWNFKMVKQIFKERRTKVSDKDYPALSVSKAGVTPQLETAAKTDNGDNRKLVKIGDFVINSRSDRKGSSGISEYEGSVSLIYTVLECITNDNLKFFHYLFRSVPFTEEYYRNGKGLVSDLWTTNYDKFKNIKIPIPPIDEQEKIVRYLDEKTAAIHNSVETKSKQVDLLEELKRSVIFNAVTYGLFSDKTPDTWKKMKLKYLVDNVSHKKKYTGGNYVGMENIESWTGKITAVNFENKSDVESILNSFDSRFILFGKLRPYLAKVAVPNFSGQCSTELLTLLPHGDINKKFLFYVMISKRFIDTVDSATYGTKMPRSNWNFIGNIKISVPKLWEQKEIADYLDNKCWKIEKLIEVLKKEISLLKELEKSIISEAVTGGEMYGD